MSGDAFPDDRPVNIHATTLLAGRAGVLIEGSSGAGKSSLALAALEAFALRGRFAALVGDDRVWLERHAGRLVAHAPAPIAGRAELRGCGIVPVRFAPSAVIDLVVTLVPGAAIERMPEPQRVERHGVALPLVRLPMRETATGLTLLMHWLALLAEIGT